MMKFGRLRSKRSRDCLPVPNIQADVVVIGEGLAQLLDHRLGRSTRTEKLLAHVIIHTDHVPTFLAKQTNTLRTDQTA